MFLSFHHFVEEFIREIKLYFPEEKYELISNQVIKNNHTLKYALEIRSKSLNMSPNYYMEGYYEDYKQGRSISSLAESMKNSYLSFEKEYVHEAEIPLDKYWAKERIICQLVHAQKNQEILLHTPYFPLEDLAVVFYLLVEQREHQIGSIRIDNSLLERIHYTKEELLSLALENMPKIFPLYFCKITDIICKYPSLERPENTFYFPENNAKNALSGFLQKKIKEGEDFSPIYVITNVSGINGASAVLYPYLLEELAEIFMGSYYLIPSSIHEMLVLPKSSEITVKSINAMINEVNEQNVAAEEVLSDHVYLYDYALKKLISRCS